MPELNKLKKVSGCSEYKLRSFIESSIGKYFCPCSELFIHFNCTIRIFWNASNSFLTFL